MPEVLLLQVLVYSFTLWFGLDLLARDWHKPGLRFAGLGLVTYALGLAVTALAESSPAWRLIPILLPSVFWMAATWHLLPDAAPSISGNMVGIGIGAAVLALIGAALNPAIAQIVVMIVPVLFLLIAAVKIRQAFRSMLPRQPLVTLGTATIFFFLGTGLLILPVEWLSSEVVLLAISGDLVLLGAALGYLDAYDEGTKLLPDALRSLAAAGLSAGLFGGQVLLFMAGLLQHHDALVAAVRGNHVAVRTFALFGEPLDERRRIGDLAATFQQRLALLDRHEHREIFLVRHHQLEPFAQDLRALLRRAPAPIG